MDYVKSEQRAPNRDGRILMDIPCKVCQDHSSGKHYGIYACDGCAGFFKRSIRRNRQYICKSRNQGSCPVDKTHRNQCRACRLQRCVEAGMNKDAVQHERGPRNSTIRRQVALYLKETSELSAAVMHASNFPRLPLPAAAAAAAIPTRLKNEPPQPASPQLVQPTPKYPHQMTASYFNNTNVCCEMAARLLFTSVKWAQNVPEFIGLPPSYQALLLEEGWRELFVLGAAQFQMPIEPASLIAASGHTAEKSGPGRMVMLMTEIRALQDIIARFKSMQVDPTEFACLKGIVIFKTVIEGKSGEAKDLPDIHPSHVQAVSSLQDHAQLTLNKYSSQNYPTQLFRFGKLLLMLSSLRSVSGSTIEDIFFKKTIGTIPIEKLLVQMFKSENFSDNF